MSERSLEFRSELALPVASLAAWYARPSALERLIPPWTSLGLAARRASSDGAELELRLPCGLFELPLRVEQTFAAHAGGALLTERVFYRPPLGALTARGARRRIERLFRYRQELARADLLRHAGVAAPRKLRVLISGATGLIGRQLALFLEAGGHEVLRLVRHAAERAGEVRWQPTSGEIERDKLAGLDAVVHLAGENAASHRWSPEQKRRIEDSRVLGTRTLVTALAALDAPPKVLLSASAIGFYGDTGSEPRDEKSPGGSGFLADVCKKWEAESRVLAERGTRVVQTRIGVVAARQSGAIQKMLLPFSLGLGGRIGSGRQYMSWISLDDVIGLLHAALVDERFAGPLNCVAPNPVSNAEMTRVLARLLRRPAFLVVPELALRILYGEFTDEALKSQRVLPAQALAHGFAFRHAELKPALAFELGLEPRGG